MQEITLKEILEMQPQQIVDFLKNGNERFRVNK